MNDYKELMVWQKSIEVAVICHNITSSFPKEELIGLTSQIRRAASSIPANIAEGSGKNSRKGFNQYLSIALRSAFELDTHLQISFKIGYISEEMINEITVLIIEIVKMIKGLQKSFKF